MRIIFLGTNGWYTTATGNTPCILIDSQDRYVIFDAGNGIYKLEQHIKEDKPISLFISHFHLDHVSGLHILNKFTFSQGLNIYVPKGRKKDFESLVAPPYTVPPANLKMKVNVSETEAIEQHHAYGDHGYRLTLENKIIAYSGDCGISKNSIPLAKNADVLIHECSYMADHPPDKWGHVGPLEAAKLAKDAGAKKLILTHFDASVYLTLADRKEAEKQAQKIFSNTFAAMDDMVVDLKRSP